MNGNRSAAGAARPIQLLAQARSVADVLMLQSQRFRRSGCAFAALVFERAKEFIGLELEIGGSELTNPETADTFSRVLGKSVKFQQLPMPLVRVVLGKELYQMFRWFNQEGFRADIKELRRCYPELHILTLEEWLCNEGWQKRVRRVRPPRQDNFRS